MVGLLPDFFDERGFLRAGLFGSFEAGEGDGAVVGGEAASTASHAAMTTSAVEVFSPKMTERDRTIIKGLLEAFMPLDQLVVWGNVLLIDFCKIQYIVVAERLFHNVLADHEVFDKVFAAEDSIISVLLSAQPWKAVASKVSSVEEGLGLSREDYLMYVGQFLRISCVMSAFKQYATYDIGDVLGEEVPEVDESLTIAMLSRLGRCIGNLRRYIDVFFGRKSRDFREWVDSVEEADSGALGGVVRICRNLSERFTGVNVDAAVKSLSSFCFYGARSNNTAMRKFCGAVRALDRHNLEAFDAAASQVGCFYRTLMERLQAVDKQTKQFFVTIRKDLPSDWLPEGVSPIVDPLLADFGALFGKVGFGLGALDDIRRKQVISGLGEVVGKHKKSLNISDVTMKECVLVAYKRVGDLSSSVESLMRVLGCMDLLWDGVDLVRDTFKLSRSVREVDDLLFVDDDSSEDEGDASAPDAKASVSSAVRCVEALTVDEPSLVEFGEYLFEIRKALDGLIADKSFCEISHFLEARYELSALSESLKLCQVTTDCRHMLPCVMDVLLHGHVVAEQIMTGLLVARGGESVRVLREGGCSAHDLCVLFSSLMGAADVPETFHMNRLGVIWGRYVNNSMRYYRRRGEEFPAGLQWLILLKSSYSEETVSGVKRVVGDWAVSFLSDIGRLLGVEEKPPETLFDKDALKGKRLLDIVPPKIITRRLVECMAAIEQFRTNLISMESGDGAAVAAGGGGVAAVDRSTRMVDELSAEAYDDVLTVNLPALENSLRLLALCKDVGQSAILVRAVMRHLQFSVELFLRGKCLSQGVFITMTHNLVHYFNIAYPLDSAERPAVLLHQRRLQMLRDLCLGIATNYSLYARSSFRGFVPRGFSLMRRAEMLKPGELKDCKTEVLGFVRAYVDLMVSLSP